MERELAEFRSRCVQLEEDNQNLESGLKEVMEALQQKGGQVTTPRGNCVHVVFFCLYIYTDLPTTVVWALLTARFKLTMLLRSGQNYYAQFKKKSRMIL